jgi:hypothetical protein
MAHAAIIAVRLLQTQPAYDHADFVATLAAELALTETYRPLPSPLARDVFERTIETFGKQPPSAPDPLLVLRG